MQTLFKTVWSNTLPAVKPPSKQGGCRAHLPPPNQLKLVCNHGRHHVVLVKALPVLHCLQGTAHDGGPVLVLDWGAGGVAGQQLGGNGGRLRVGRGHSRISACCPCSCESSQYKSANTRNVYACQLVMSLSTCRASTVFWFGNPRPPSCCFSSTLSNSFLLKKLV